MKKKTVAALALSAVLAMGTVPAFAADPIAAGDATDPSDINKTTGQTTTVSVKTTIGQISATIPTKVVINASTDGGEVGVPSAEKYKITNGSIFDLKVKSINATAGADWEFKANKIEGNPDMPGPTVGKVGDIYMTLTPQNAAADKKFTLTNTAAFTPDDAWVIPAHSASGDGSLGLTLYGTTSKLSGIFTDDSKLSEAMVITYMVEAKPTVTTPAENPEA